MLILSNTKKFTIVVEEIVVGHVIGSMSFERKEQEGERRNPSK